MIVFRLRNNKCDGVSEEQMISYLIQFVSSETVMLYCQVATFDGLNAA